MICFMKYISHWIVWHWVYAYMRGGQGDKPLPSRPCNPPLGLHPSSRRKNFLFFTPSLFSQLLSPLIPPAPQLPLSPNQLPIPLTMSAPHICKYMYIWECVHVFLHALTKLKCRLKVSGVQIGNFLCLVRYWKLYIFWKVVMPTTQI